MEVLGQALFTEVSAGSEQREEHLVGERRVPRGPVRGVRHGADPARVRPRRQPDVPPLQPQHSARQPVPSPDHGDLELA